MRKNLNSIIKTITIFFFVALFLCCKKDAKKADDVQEKEKSGLPNVVLILSDDQGWGDLSITGNTNIKTPNIDKLAANGAMFNRFYVSPFSSPTRAEILTGRYHVRSGVYSTSEGGERFDLDETTIADVFKENGYRTAAYGKWHSGMQYPYHPNGRGFEDFYGFCSGHWGNYFDPMLERNGKIVDGNGYITDDLTEKAIEFVDANKDNPFFLYVPYNTPHSPMQVPDEYWNNFEIRELKQLHRYSDLEDINHTKAALAMCENIDQNVGRLIQKLESLQLLENTIIVYLSDNGPNGYRWNGGLKGKKGDLDEGGVRSPCFVQRKGKIKGGLKIDQVASGIDLFPTLIGLTGIDYVPNGTIDGKDLKSLLFEVSKRWDERYIFTFWEGKTSLRDEEFMLDEDDKLYNLSEDPGQYIDVSKNYPEVLLEMSQAKNKWVAEVASELPEEDTRTFPLGHPNFAFNQLPARDGQPHGSIKRSNRYPNSSFFTNWNNIEDSITWDVDVVEDGEFEAVIYYTCSEENLGSVIELSLGNSSLKTSLNKPYESPLLGGELDRVPRQESYEKNWGQMTLGNIKLKKGQGQLKLRALEIPNNGVMDFRLMTLKKIESIN